jgi:hypothetical protein
VRSASSSTVTGHASPPYVPNFKGQWRKLFLAVICQTGGKKAKRTFVHTDLSAFLATSTPNKTRLQQQAQKERGEDSRYRFGAREKFGHQ